MASFFQKFSQAQSYSPTSDVNEVTVIDMHTGGEPLRVIQSGYPNISASSLLDYRQQLTKDFDDLRKAIILEPRGHADMYACLVLQPFDQSADCSVIFMHNEGYSTMCGHAVIGLMTLAVKMGWAEVENHHASLIIEAPCGLIKASAKIKNDQIIASFECVPSFVLAQAQKLFLPSLQKEIQFDLAYGGAFYAYVNAEQVELKLDVNHYYSIIQLGQEIKQAVINSQLKVEHPLVPELGFLYGTIFVEDVVSDRFRMIQKSPPNSRNVCVFADGEVDRSPTGSGVAGRAALHYSRNEIGLNEPFVVESIIGSQFEISVIAETQVGNFKAIVPKISGEAFICGFNRLVIDDHDQVGQGFLLR